MSSKAKTTAKKPRKTTAKRKPRRKAAAKQPKSIGEYVRLQRNLADKSLRKVAEQTGISTSLLSDIERGIRQPSRAILGSLAGALRLSADTLNLQAGVLDPQDADESDVVREIERDPMLSERHAEILIDLYRTFRALADSEL